MICVYRTLRGTFKTECICRFITVEEADEFVKQNTDPCGSWLYFREQTQDERIDEMATWDVGQQPGSSPGSDLKQVTIWVNLVTQELIVGMQTSKSAKYWFITSITGERRCLGKDIWRIFEKAVKWT